MQKQHTYKYTPLVTNNEENSEDLYAMLKDTITLIKIDDDLIVLGDFNGKPGK
jgi:hypothetical protein